MTPDRLPFPNCSEASQTVSDTDGNIYTITPLPSADYNDPERWPDFPVCHCGTSTVEGAHPTGEHGCVRRVVPAPMPFRCLTTREFRWLVNGALITDYTLRHQRGYHQHPDGRWTSHGSSTNSIDA